MIKAAIFDCFGVIRPDNLTEAYARLGGDVEKDANFILNTIQAVNHGYIPSSRPVFAEKLGVSVETWTATLLDSKGNNAEILTYIEELRQQYKTALMSNVGKDGLQLIFRPEELARYFDVAVGSGDIGHAKPDPQTYLITAAKLGVEPEECVMIDDQAGYCTAARAVGMQAIIYFSLPQLKTELNKLFGRLSPEQPS